MDDLTGRKYGRWTVIKRAENHITSGGYSVTMWNCVCKCGNIRVVRGSDLKSGKSKSCGCLLADEPTTKTHGESGTHLYMIYHGMKSRCNNPNNKNYKDYGGRGISICQEWENVEAFIRWAKSNGYKDGLSIDRIDVNGNYCPENCRWVTMDAQKANRRDTIRPTAFGRTQTLSEWAKEAGIQKNTIKMRLRRGWNVERALTEPVKGGMTA